ncbi:MAG: UDP binding domain-containing protein [Pirellulaceae bacterium]
MADLDAAIEYQPDLYAAACNAHALAVMTDWHEYTSLDYPRIYTSMTKPAALFDGRNCLDHAALCALGFDVYAMGKVPHCA